MFIDKARIIVSSGKGGDGHVSFRREKYVPAGGPDGGDGGKGGDVVFVVDEGLNTLTDFRHVRKYAAQHGEDGKKKRMAGKKGQDLEIKVPEGTVIREANSGKVIADMSGDLRRYVILKGGRGGNGNMHYATSTMQAPKYAQPGQPSRTLELLLELKMIADVGLVGFPNVGKSTLLSMSSNAKPRIANYHFTTLQPILGVVDLDDARSFVMADIPGLIEGAADGAGLGHEFLAHLERTRILIHVVDASGSEGRDPIEDFEKINSELLQYSKSVADKPMLVCANKIDLTDEEDPEYLRFKEYVEGKGYQVFPVSAPINYGVQALLDAALAELQRVLREPQPEPEIEYFDFETDDVDPEYRTVNVDTDEDGFVVTGKQLRKIFDSTNFNDFGSLRYLYKYIEKSGAIDRMKEMGLDEGDTIKVFDYEFEYYDEF